MKSYVLLTFGLLGWTFYTLSDGADYVPKEGSRQAVAMEKRAAAEMRMASAIDNQTDSGTSPAADQNDTAGVAMQSISDELGIAPGMLVINPQSTEAAPQQAVLAATSDNAAAGLTEAGLTEADQPNARIASLTLAEPAAFAQAAGFAPVTDASDGTNDAAQEAEFQRLEDLRQITGNRVNMRTGPGTSYGITAQVTRGTEVEVLDGLSTGWLQLRIRESQQIGWVAASLVSGREG